jgi:hypothetical protein
MHTWLHIDTTLARDTTYACLSCAMHVCHVPAYMCEIRTLYTSRGKTPGSPARHGTGRRAVGAISECTYRQCFACGCFDCSPIQSESPRSHKRTCSNAFSKVKCACVQLACLRRNTNEYRCLCSMHFIILHACYCAGAAVEDISAVIVHECPGHIYDTS